MLREGAQVGKYTIQTPLGQGGMGAVYRAYDPGLERCVALKVMNTNLEGVDHALSRFAQEAKAIARLSSPHVVHVYECDAAQTPPYIAMEYVCGGNLHALIKEHAPLPVGTTLRYARHVLMGLKAAHEAGVIHRDIKPANMLLQRPDDLVKLTDFGLARSLDVDMDLTVSGTVVGTLHYMAPEVARGDEATATSDLYSAGISFYEMLSGTLPFREESPLKLLRRIAAEAPPPIESVCESVPPLVGVWLRKLLAVDPKERYASAAAALEDLDKIEGKEVRESRARPPEAGDETTFLDPSQIQPAQESANAPVDETPVETASASPGGDGLAGAHTPGDPLGGLQQEDVQAVIRRAMAWEKERNNRIDEAAFLGIAQDLGLHPDAARCALREHEQAMAQRMRTRRILRIAGAATLLVVVVALTIHGMTRHVPQVRTVKSVHIGVETDWRRTSVVLDAARPVLLIAQSGEGGDAMEFRVGESGDAVAFRGAYYGVPGRYGAVALRAPGGAVQGVQVAADKRLRVAVLPFSGGAEGSSTREMAEGTGETMATRLAESGLYRMVERAQVDAVITNLDLENSRYFDADTATQIGNLLGVEYVVQGAVQGQGGRVRMTARLVDAGTGRILSTHTVEGAVLGLFSLQDRLAEAHVRSPAPTFVRALLGEGD